jgi:hypothetical protein
MSDDFNFDGNQSSSRGWGGRLEVWDILSILMLTATVCLVVYFGFIFINPNSELNFLPPGGLGPKTATPTVTPLQLEATWTASPTIALTPSDTPRPTFTPFSTNTPFSLIPPTRTPKPPTPTRTPKAPFGATTQQVESTVVHPEFSCNWAGIGGTVVDTNNSHIVGQVIVLRGTLDGKTIDQQTVSGINKEYGPSGFEFVLGNAPLASTTLYVQLVDLNGLPLSDKISVPTSADCTKNLVLMRFKKNN